jgi:hypothetical protein
MAANNLQDLAYVGSFSGAYVTVCGDDLGASIGN